jgi:hypothetical protein
MRQSRREAKENSSRVRLHDLNATRVRGLFAADSQATTATTLGTAGGEDTLNIRESNESDKADKDFFHSKYNLKVHAIVFITKKL